MHAAVTFLFAASLAGTAAAAEDPSAFVRALEAVPGVTITHGENGGHPYTEWRRSGVFYRLEKGAGRDTLFGDDESGGGAVICSWMVDNAVRDALDDCPADRFRDLRADLDRDIPAIEAFIVANNVMSTSVAELRARAAAERIRTAGSRPHACAAGDAGALIQALDGMGSAGRREAVDKLLATPRWPVPNPCL